jgi:anti-sigma regulatory factor (Ser/Thr protein kinase)
MLNDVDIADTNIRLPSTCADVGEIEAIIRHLFLNICEPRLLKIDMNDVVYITAPCLIYLISFTENVLEKGYEVRYHLPADIGVRDILRIWRFPVVIREITGRGFASLVRNEDLIYFGESHLSGDYYKTFSANDEGLAELIKKDFFSLVSVPFSNDVEKSFAIDNQHRKWSEEIIKSILKRHLATYDGVNENLIPNRIIYECMTNAFRHSKAVKLVTGAYFDRRGNFLTITFWDNGESIISTLRRALEENHLARVKDNDGNDLNLGIHFSISVKSNMKDELIDDYYHSDIDPTLESNYSELLLAAVTPGVSRDPYGKDIRFSRNPFLESDIQQFNKPGMGLTTLLNATIDLLDGSVAIRSGSYFVNFKKPTLKEYDNYTNKSGKFKYKRLYKAKVIKYEDHVPTFKGNMITIRLPLIKS